MRKRRDGMIEKEPMLSCYVGTEEWSQISNQRKEKNK